MLLYIESKISKGFMFVEIKSKIQGEKILEKLKEKSPTLRGQILNVKKTVL